MKKRPKSSRDKKRKSEDKKQLAKIAASEPESTVKREAIAAPSSAAVAKPESVAAPKPESVAPKAPAAKPEQVAPKPKEAALKPKEPAANPKAAVPERKEAVPQHEGVAHKRKDVAVKPPAPAQVAVLEIRSPLSAPSVESPQPVLDEAAPAIEWPFEAPGQGALAVNRKLIDFARANLTSSFDHARNLAGAKSPVEMMQMQMCYWRERISVLASQAEELRALSAELVASASEPIRRLRDRA